jgi:hypothetical protein
MFMVRNAGAFSNTNADAAYSWAEIDLSNPNDMMLTYLDGFYAEVQSSKYTAGSGYKGFNDTLATWGSNRIINQKYGLTSINTLAETKKVLFHLPPVPGHTGGYMERLRGRHRD